MGLQRRSPQLFRVTNDSMEWVRIIIPTRVVASRAQVYLDSELFASLYGKTALYLYYKIMSGHGDAARQHLHEDWKTIGFDSGNVDDDVVWSEQAKLEYTSVQQLVMYNPPKKLGTSLVPERIAFLRGQAEELSKKWPPFHAADRSFFSSLVSHSESFQNAGIDIVGNANLLDFMVQMGHIKRERKYYEFSERWDKLAEEVLQRLTTPDVGETPGE